MPQSLRADVICMLLAGVGVSGLVDFKGSWKDTIFVVFLMPWAGVVFSGLADTRGFLKVMLFFIMMMWRVTALIWERGALLGTLDPRIPRQSDVAHDSRICGLMESQKMQKWVGYDLGTDLC